MEENFLEARGIVKRGPHILTASLHWSGHWSCVGREGPAPAIAFGPTLPGCQVSKPIFWPVLSLWMCSVVVLVAFGLVRCSLGECFYGELFC